MTAPAIGSTAAVLMHHSRTAFGNWSVNSGSGVSPTIVKTSLHHRYPIGEGVEIHLRRVRVEHSDLVDAIAAVRAGAGVVVVLAEDQVLRRASVRRDERRRDNRGGAVPAEPAG